MEPKPKPGTRSLSFTFFHPQNEINVSKVKSFIFVQGGPSYIGCKMFNDQRHHAWNFATLPLRPLAHNSHGGARIVLNRIAMLASLSLDTALLVLSFLTVSDVANLYLLSRDYRRFLCDNENAIYHQIAVQLRFVPPRYSLDEAIRSAAWLRSVTTWKDFCEC